MVKVLFCGCNKATTNKESNKLQFFAVQENESFYSGCKSDELADKISCNYKES